MHDATERLVDAHLAACCEPDAARRGEAVRRLWHPEGRLVDPPLAAFGHAGIADQAGTLLAQCPGHRFVRTTAVDRHHEFARYGWSLVDPAGRQVLEGVDVLQLDVDGRIARVVGFFGAQPAPLGA
ncbi:MAG TPA: nuclear transport factor 2 family protein [Ramlibacter sp.]|uniref:nuclear transport factor 2 family protein n=1 Tax=Ramlibacter sp. TaxID=1917967 RepID=UPI002D556733|nr:nuclear transport factor 2 family protein [Ramlibacter sp.]HZY18811.1 nuclear transport factor 2 family protein [Ramlibacter sp.]